MSISISKINLVKTVVNSIQGELTASGLSYVDPIISNLDVQDAKADNVQYTDLFVDFLNTNAATVGTLTYTDVAISALLATSEPVNRITWDNATVSDGALFMLLKQESEDPLVLEEAIEVFLSKIVGEIVNTSDYVYLDTEKSVKDYATIYTLVEKAFNKALIDTFAVEDFIKLFLTNHKQDILNTFDAVSVISRFTRKFQDTDIVVPDIVSLSTTKPFSSTGIISDNSFLDIIRKPSESINTSDILSYDFVKQINDSDGATVSDYNILAINKQIGDNVMIGDDITLNVVFVASSIFNELIFNNSTFG